MSGESFISPQTAKLIWLCFGGLLVAAIALAGGAKFFGESGGDIAAKEYQKSESLRTPAGNCIEAGRVAEAYLNDRDEANYARWKQRERLVCLNASICQDLIGGCGSNPIL